MGRAKLKGREEEVVELYKSGMSAEKIAHRFETHHTTVLDALKRMGVERRSGWGWHQRKQDKSYMGWSSAAIAKRRDRYERWAMMYRAGMTLSEIARKEDASLETMRRGLIYWGVAMRPKGTPKDPPKLKLAQKTINALREIDTREAIVAERKARRREKQREIDARIERMMNLACPKRRRYAA